MINISKDIQSLSDFKRNTSKFMKRMKGTGRPVVLTVNGSARIVVQDAEAYQRLLEVADRAEAIQGIREGLEAFKRGEGVPALPALDRIRKKHDIPRRD